jgi:3-methyladenine DNA glycosylase AlkD
VAARKVALRFAGDFRLADFRALLASGVNEHRYVALEMLVRRYETGDRAAREKIARLYIRSLRYVDHWVLVDTSAPYILGDYLLAKDRAILFELASSRDPMRRRIAIVATMAFIRARDFDDTLRIAQRLLRDEHELIHRAVGWMLREVGKRSEVAAERFLDGHFRAMPRLMLRYAIDQLPEARRKRYLRRGDAQSDETSRRSSMSTMREEAPSRNPAGPGRVRGFRKVPKSMSHKGRRTRTSPTKAKPQPTHVM